MVDVFELKICGCCKNRNCSHNIITNEGTNLLSYKCNEYVKDLSKITPYEKPLTITAERDYISAKEF